MKHGDTLAHNEVEISVKLVGAMSEWLEINMGVHQGSVLSPLLFTIVMDVVR